MHVFLSVLSTIGFVLLVILAVILALILLILLFPLSYRGRFRKQGEELSFRAHVGWLFGAVLFRIAYVDRKLSYELYLLGIPFFRFRAWRKKKKAERPPKLNRAEKRKRPTVPPGGEKSEMTKDTGQRDQTNSYEGRKEKFEEVKQSDPADDTGKSDQDEQNDQTDQKRGKLRSIPGRVLGAIRKFCFTIRSVCGKIREWTRFLKSPEFRAAFAVVWKEGKKLLRHILPRKLWGSIRFGFEDPALTGEVLGAAAMVYPVLPRKLKIYPEFEESCLEADVKFRGHIILVVVLVHALKILLQQDVKVMIKKLRHKEA